MASIKFKVNDKPPKKIRGKSLWTFLPEALRIKELRDAAYHESGSQNFKVLEGPVSIKIEIHLHASSNNSASPEAFWGDLDNIVSGICEGLETAYTQYIYKSLDPTNGKPLIYIDDSQVAAIYAEKIIAPESCPEFSYVEGSPSPFYSSFVLPLTLPRPGAHQAAFSYSRSTSVPAPWLSV